MSRPQALNPVSRVFLLILLIFPFSGEAFVSVCAIAPVAGRRTYSRTRTRCAGYAFEGAERGWGGIASLKQMEAPPVVSCAFLNLHHHAVKVRPTTRNFISANPENLILTKIMSSLRISARSEFESNLLGRISHGSANSLIIYDRAGTVQLCYCSLCRVSAVCPPYAFFVCLFCC